jgi:hypothetical protein
MVPLSSWGWPWTVLLPRLAHQLRFFIFGLGHSDFRSSTFAAGTRRIAGSGRFRFSGVPNPALNSDPACIVFRSFSSFRFLDFAQRFGAGAAG